MNLSLQYSTNTFCLLLCVAFYVRNVQDCNLLKSLTEPNSSMTSAERAIRHGELKLLKSLKKTYKQREPKRRKQLKVETFDIQLEDNDDNGELDIKDIEFRMRNDSSQVQNLLTASTACSYKDLTMLKLILCSGLYPQFACADEFNYCKVKIIFRMYV